MTKNKTFFSTMEQEHKKTISPKVLERTVGVKTIPELRLSGIWLEGAGFKAGERVIIEVGDKELIIRAV
jgi:hypothetical protein